MTTIVNFYNCDDGIYHADDDEDVSGNYVPLAEYQKLESLIQRVDKIADLHDSPYGQRSPELIQLLKDCREAL